MRAFFVLAGLSLGGSALAGGGFLGTKASPTMGPMQADAGGTGLPFLQMMLALGIVLVLLKFILPKLVTKLNKKIVTKVGSAIQIEESANFAGGTLYIVKAKSKTLLLSVTSAGVTCLSDLSAAGAEPDVPTFQELVEMEIEGPMQPFAVVEAELDQGAASSESHDAAAALERLKRLAG